MIGVIGDSMVLNKAHLIHHANIARGSYTMSIHQEKTCKIVVDFQIKSSACFDSSYYNICMSIDGQLYMAMSFGWISMHKL